MRTDHFHFDLPEDRIAQAPAPQRDQARMMVVDRRAGTLAHRRVSDLVDYLHGPDLLVVNDTKVIPARLLGEKVTTGGQVELLLLEEVEDRVWDVLMRCSRRPAPGAGLRFGDGELTATLIADGAQGRARVRFEGSAPLEPLFEKWGHPPLPPYIRRKEVPPEQEAIDRDRYQTVYAATPGAVAAPTAGLHFTPQLFKALAAQGVERTAITLHVGLGTFRPVTSEVVAEHQMEAERYVISAAAAQRIEAARAAGGRIVGVGSTSVRTLETVAAANGQVVEARGRSSLYIYPPYTFRVVDVMLTNFHLPKSTLLMMVCAFGGYDLMMSAYAEAVAEAYRFYSYGDCMLIV